MNHSAFIIQPNIPSTMHFLCFILSMYGKIYKNHFWVAFVKHIGKKNSIVYFLNNVEMSLSLSFVSFPDPSNPELLIGSFAVQRQLGIGPEWSQDVQVGTQTELRYSYRIICKENYYGDTCSKICTPRDDRFGHYTCKPDGDIDCLSGWKGEYCQERKENVDTVVIYLAVKVP